MASLSGRPDEILQGTTDQLLRALIAEVRGLRRLVERTQRVSPSVLHESLLAGVAALLGESEWSCNVLIERARVDAGPAAAQLRSALDELDIADPFALGTYLRSRIGMAANGLELRRPGLGANKVARWSVLAP